MLVLPLLYYVTFLLPTSQSANVLVVAGWRGSHLYLAADIADKLAESGHNVTLLTVLADLRVSMKHRNFTVVTFGKEDETGEFKRGMETLYERALHHPSRDMAANFWNSLWRDKDMILWRESLVDLNKEYFLGDGFLSLLNNSNFELAVLDDTVVHPAIVELYERGVPTIGIMLWPVNEIKQWFGLPRLMNSEPCTMNDVTDSPPTLLERLQTVARSTRLALSFKPPISGVKNIVNSVNSTVRNFDIDEHYDIVFVLDHPAFSFPFLKPPNTFYLGFFDIENHSLQPLEEEYEAFLNNCPHKHNILFSFGSYLRDISTFSGTAIILRTLKKMDVCVIIKGDVDLSLKFDLQPDKFLQKSWVPQRDLLGSGKIDLFLNHCGNNGRIEAIYYNVPMLCVPLFGDQYDNSKLVDRNEFGVMLTRERLSEETLKESLETMFLKRENFTKNLRRAADIARNDPGAGVGALRFYSDLLIRNGNADFLINKIIITQSAFEVYNYDFAAVAVILIYTLAVGIMYCLVKILKSSLGMIIDKTKTE